MIKHSCRMVSATFWISISLSLSILSSPVMADVPLNEQATATGGWGKWLLSVLFEAGTINNQAVDAGIIGSVIRPFSLVCMLVIVFLIIAKSLQHVLVVAQAKDVESSPISMTWAPIHLVVAVILAVPLPTGYSSGQYGAIWVAEQSNLLGNLTSRLAVGDGEYTVVTEVPMPGIRTTIQGIVDSEVCTVIVNAMGDYMESQGGSRLSVNPRPMTQAEITQIAGGPANTYDDNGGFKRTGIVYEILRSSGSGGWVNQPGGINSACGSIIVETDSYFQTNDSIFQHTATQKGDSDIGNTGCGNTILCGEVGMLVEKEDAKNKVAAAFIGANDRLSAEFMALRNSAEVRSAVEALTFDVEAYFESLSNSDAQKEYRALQAEEVARIETASTQIVTAIDRLQGTVYSVYGETINQLRSANQQTGDSHKDAVLRTGWPVLGLYWFQQQSYNSAVMDSVNFTANARMSVGSLIQLTSTMIGDPLFTDRLTQRLSEYRRAVNRQVMNTRLDTDPLATAADGSVASSALSRGDANIAQASTFAETTSTYMESMLESAASADGDVGGALTGDGTGGWGPSHFSRTILFPWIVAGLRDDNLVTGLVNTGHNLIVTAEVLYGITLFSRAWDSYIEHQNSRPATSAIMSFVTSPVSTVAGTATSKVLETFTHSLIGRVIMTFIQDLSGVILYLFFLGIFLAFYLPAVVMVQWLIGLVQWMIYVIEAVVVIPLWAILFVGEMGQKAFAPQAALQGFMHLLSILFYPALMVIGFTIGIKVLDVVGVFLIDFIMIGFLGLTAGYSFGIVSLIAGLTLVGIVAYQVIMRIFSGMLELNDRAIAWIGNRSTFGENNAEQATRSALVAVLGKGEGLGHRSQQRSGNKAPSAKPTGKGGGTPGM